MLKTSVAKDAIHAFIIYPIGRVAGFTSEGKPADVLLKLLLSESGIVRILIKIDEFP